VAYLTKVLREHESPRTPMRPVYAITGTGHHSKNGKDKIGKAIRTFLTEWRYAFREFSVPGDRGNMGGIVGIDPASWDRTLERERDAAEGGAGGGGDARVGESTKVRILKKEDLELDPTAAPATAVAAGNGAPAATADESGAL
jgi:hypothetical protein